MLEHLYNVVVVAEALVAVKPVAVSEVEAIVAIAVGWFEVEPR